jgi:NADH-quinone oxidoreductase subunit N
VVTLLPILPETLVLVLAILLLVIDPFQKKEKNRRPFLGIFSALGLLLILILSLLFARPTDPIMVFGGMLRFDWLGFLFKMFFIFAAAVTALFFMDVDRLNQRAEAYLMMLAATIGMCLMASSADLVML